MKLKWKRLSSLLLTLCMVVSLLAGSGTTVSAATPDLAFPDLDTYEWAADAIAALKVAGIVNGKADNNGTEDDTSDDYIYYDPGAVLTRQELATVLDKAFNLPDAFKNPDSQQAKSSFEDVNAKWAIPYIEAAKYYFFYNNNFFQPLEPVTREQMAYSFVKVFGYSTDDADMAKAAEKYSKDWGEVDDTYKPAVALCTTLGFLSGDGNGKFEPEKTINRAEMAVLFYRLLKFGGGAGGGKFSDVKPGDWYFNSVMNLVNRGIFDGYDDGTYRPNEDINYKELPKWISKIIGDGTITTDVLNTMPSTITIGGDNVTVYQAVYDEVYQSANVTREVLAFTFSNICQLAVPGNVDGVLSVLSDEDDIEYRDEVASVISASCEVSVSDSVYMLCQFDEHGDFLFNPKGSFTRAELAVLMEKALPEQAISKSGQIFTDVATTDWYYDGVMNLYNRGIVKGYGDGRFGPNDELGINMAWLVARHLNHIQSGYNPLDDPDVLAYFPNGTFADTKEAAAFAVVKMLEIDVTQVNAEDILERFADKEEISSACKQTMAYLVSVGALKGNQDGELAPQEKITRGTFAVFYARVLNGIDASKMKDYENTIDAVKNEGGS